VDGSPALRLDKKIAHAEHDAIEGAALKHQPATHARKVEAVRILVLVVLGCHESPGRSGGGIGGAKLQGGGVRGCKHPGRQGKDHSGQRVHGQQLLRGAHVGKGGGLLLPYQEAWWLPTRVLLLDRPRKYPRPRRAQPRRS